MHSKAASWQSTATATCEPSLQNMVASEISKYLLGVLSIREFPPFGAFIRGPPCSETPTWICTVLVVARAAFKPLRRPTSTDEDSTKLGWWLGLWLGWLAGEHERLLQHYRGCQR